MNRKSRKDVAILQFCLSNTTVMKKLTLALLALLLGLSAANAQTLSEGLKYLENENYTSARETFEAIARNDPKNASIYYYIGEVSYRLEQYGDAEKAFQNGLSVSSTCAECKIGLGKLALDKGDVSGADEFFQSALRLDKKNPDIPFLIGEAYLDSKKPDANKAITFLMQASDMNPKEAKYLAELGDAYKAVNNNGEAMTAYERAVKLNPNNTQAYISMARIWSAAKQTDLAIEQLETARKLSPNDALVYKDLIEIYVAQRQYDKVTPLLEKYVTLTGTDVDAKVRFIKFLVFQAKDYDRAIKEGDALLKTNPEQYTLHRWLAWAYGEKQLYQESYDHSIKLFDAIEKDKDNRQAYPSDYEYWAKAAMALGKTDEAAHIYRKYVELVPEKTAEVYALIAKKYFDERNFEQAINYYTRKDEAKPLNTAERYYVGLSQFYTDKNLEADTSFAKVLEASPEYAPGWLMRARIANRIDTAQTAFTARPFYEKYLEYGYSDPEKNKKNLIESHKFMAYYYVQNDSKDMAIAEYEKILKLDPADQTSIEYLKLLKSQ